MWWESHFTSAVFLPKTLDESKLRDILENAWLVLLKTVKVISQGKAEKLLLPREAKETDN